MKPTHNNPKTTAHVAQRNSTALKQFSYFSLLLFTFFATAVSYTTHSYSSIVFVGAIVVFPVCVYAIAHYLANRK